MDTTHCHKFLINVIENTKWSEIAINISVNFKDEIKHKNDSSLPHYTSHIALVIYRMNPIYHLLFRCFSFTYNHIKDQDTINHKHTIEYARQTVRIAHI